MISAAAAHKYKNLDVIIFDLCQRSFKSEKPQRDAGLSSYK